MFLLQVHRPETWWCDIVSISPIILIDSLDVVQDIHNNQIHIWSMEPKPTAASLQDKTGQRLDIYVDQKH